MRRTKIVCTLGPSTNSPAMIAALADAGMSVARINFSHGTQEEHANVIKAVQSVNAKREVPVALLLDTKGAEIRTGDRKEPLAIKKGDEVVFAPFEPKGEKRPIIHVNYDGFAQDVQETTRIILDNGELFFSVVRIDPSGFVVAKAEDDGAVGSRRHINLPGADIDLPSVTEKDWEDIAFGADLGMDCVALSFIRAADEVQEVQEFLRKRGSSMQVIAKIETQQAVENLEAIIRQSDGIMVARGDLGAEIPFERIPAIQDRMVARCRELGKPVIVATHMLESMIVNPMPTRAEVTDVAHAATTRSDATMLSGETAKGKHPIAALQAMDRILRETEEHLPPFVVPAGTLTEDEARAKAGVTMAQAIHARAIIALTRTGRTASIVSSFRPTPPILAIANDPAVCRSLQLRYGILPICIDLPDDREKAIGITLDALTKQGLLREGDKIVLLADAKTEQGPVGTVQVRTL